MKITNHLIEIFKTNQGGVYQCNQKRCFWVDFAGVMTPYTVNSFNHLKQMISKIDLERMATEISKGSDLAIISPLDSERCYVLNIKEILEFKEILEGAKVMLELNSILYEKLYSLPVFV